MTVNFRIESVHLDTSAGAVKYSFSGDLVVLVGQTGVGKTTLLELIKFGLGGDGQLAPVAGQNVTDVHLSIHIGSLRVQLSRGLDPERRRSIRILDLVTGERQRDHFVGGNEPSISDFLLNAMTLDPGIKAAARGSRSTSAGSLITFNDVFRFMYVPQARMNRDIAGSDEGYYDPKRKSVFELLFGITSSEILTMRSEINTLRGEIELAQQEAAVVEQFLADTGQTTRLDAEAELERAKSEQSEAQSVLLSLQDQLAEAVDSQAQVLRDLLNEAERGLAEARELTQELTRQREEYETERRRVSQDIQRLARMSSAGLRLANIEFSMCPRCTQRLDQRMVPAGTCPVCLQDDIVEGLHASDQYESAQLREQLAEITEQIRLLSDQAHQAAAVAARRHELVRSLSTGIDERTAVRVTPRLQAYGDAAARVAAASAEQRSLERALIQWDRAEDLAAHAETLVTRRAELQGSLRSSEAELHRRRAELFDELDDEFQTTVRDFGIPSVETASISRDTYLPLLNGSPFADASAGGGIITATQVAYWITLVTVSARRRDTRFPTFLLLDSPRLALGTQEDIAAQMYRRFATQVAVTPGRLQFIVADNDLPAGLDRGLDRLDFSYDSPTVSSVPHPGLAHVETLTDET
ncbi:AAA family ATPase [Ornithinimicrobium murale]|uniref:AAA family ATPase n=1 Tax=Ornithinimicrobium murale TaxID=1050153 RepID=UPI000E0E06B3|nr:AAA family ATPase [Ornithinimicrobium murale]